MLEPLNSRLFFRPSHHYLPSEKREMIISAKWGQVQIWREYHFPASANRSAEAQLLILRFLGSRGRAEMATLDPANRIPEIPSEIWTVNAPGFGTTTGPASLARYGDCALLAHEALLKHAEGRPVWVAGKSLGTAAALLATAHLGASGLILRNAMPLRELMVRRYGWWNLWIPAWITGRHIPQALDSVRNAIRCRAPALFLVSKEDRIVPPDYQQRVIRAYGGNKKVLWIDGGHDERILAHHDEKRYADTLRAFATRTIL
jgi:pimeloyl-ACP methyl ester carboxylesterase